MRYSCQNGFKKESKIGYKIDSKIEVQNEVQNESKIMSKNEVQISPEFARSPIHFWIIVGTVFGIVVYVFLDPSSLISGPILTYFLHDFQHF